MSSHNRTPGVWVTTSIARTGPVCRVTTEPPVSGLLLVLPGQGQCVEWFTTSIARTGPKTRTGNLEKGIVFYFLILLILLLFF